jgi:hypothetical protein
LSRSSDSDIILERCPQDFLEDDQP